MFERYTEAARRVIFFARYEAGHLGARMIDTEHLLQGLVRQDQALLTATVGQAATEQEIRRRLGVRIGDELPTHVDMPLSPAGKRSLAFAAEEMTGLGQRLVRTEHLLLGLLREQGCQAERVLKSLGADLPRIREHLRTREPPVYPDVKQVGTAMPYRTPAATPAGIWDETEPRRIGFERYTDKARRAIFFARYEASQFGSEAIGSEHLLLGIWREGAGLINDLLDKHDPWPQLRERIEAHSPKPRKKISTSVDMPLSEQVKQALAAAADEMTLRNGSQIGIDDLLLGLLLVKGCFAAELLGERGANIEAIRRKRG